MTSAGTLRLLLTGFEPFGGEPLNPSWELVRELLAGPTPAGLELHGACLPVDRTTFRPSLEQALARATPHAVLALGQATGRAQVHLETRAVNLLDYRGGTDNGGHRSEAEPLHVDGPPQLTSTLPFPALRDELAEAGHPVRLSDDAGRYLCNALLYELLFKHAQLPSGFVHLPLSPEQASRRQQGEPSLGQDVTAPCLRLLLDRLARRLGPAAPHVVA